VKQEIKNMAGEIGFDLFGITTPDILTNDLQRLVARKKAGYWPVPFIEQNINKLVDPKDLFEKAESIISLGTAYNFKVENEEKYFISNYARGIDYHLLIEEMMNKLIVRLNLWSKNKYKFKAFVDTVPLLERAVARKAGLGWIGKNTSLINEKFGSYIFLSEIITDMKIEPDLPINPKCGDCKKCIVNCKGDALKEPYLLDSQSCLAYLTQKKGYLTENEKSLLSSHIWGCDACQSSCPYNQNIPESNHQALMPILRGDPTEILNFSRNNPPKQWQNAALSWRGMRILQRNTIISIVNNHDLQYLPLLKNLIDDNSPIIRNYAKWAIKELEKGN